MIELLGLFEFDKEGVDIFVFDFDRASQVVLLVVGQGRQNRRCGCFISHMANDLKYKLLSNQIIFQSNNYIALPLSRKVVKEDKTSSAAGG